MAKQTDIGIFILFLIVPYLALLLIGLLLIGDMQWTFLLLGLLPMVLILLGFFTRFSGAAQRWQRFFEIEQHMTETERKHFNKLNLWFGLKLWAIIGLCEAFALILLRDHFPGYLVSIVFCGSKRRLLVFYFRQNMQEVKIGRHFRLARLGKERRQAYTFDKRQQNFLLIP
jgi:hypothetical protein